MREDLAQNLLHALVAAAVIEVLLRRWRLAHPSDRLAFRLLALALPLVSLTAFPALAPSRLDPAFADRFALFASAHWSELRVAGVGVGTLALVASALAGTLLYLRDFAPLVREWRGDRHGRPFDPGDPIVRQVAELTVRVGLATPPRVYRLDDDLPVLFATGVVRPTLVVSRGALDRLDGAQLDAALAHELAHLRRGDVPLGWAVVVARTLMIGNPVAQVVARGVALEMERCADDTAALALAAPGALADGMERLVGARLEHAQRRPGRGFNRLVLGLTARGRAAALDRRVVRLRAAWPPTRQALPAMRVGLTSVALVGLLFFIV